MKHIRKGRLAALFVLLAALLVTAAGCGGSGADREAAPGQASLSAPASSAGQTQPGDAAASASAQSSQQASATATAPSGEPKGASATAKPGTASNDGAAKPSGGKVPTATADAGSAPTKPEASATGETPTSTPTATSSATPAATPATPSATAGGKPSAPPQSGQATPSPSPAATQAPQKAEITLSIVGDSDTGTILSPAAVELKSGDSVLDVLKRATRSRKMQMEYQGSGAAVYVEGIDNLYEFDKGAKSGWLFRVNGDFPGKSAGAYKLKAGDVVEWLYTLDMGKDVGKGGDGEESGS
ncbi:protein of unknown function [Cohnella sp. OV330]|uniref:DUF4430 domain-containing protein n=1 Tax=Cohnella sp. OV330 TaxID=1855288 RepID=UPI0008F3D350|nr:DUF4430 domain-containing protein [Cohnella sp. OV330]SFB55738.1 protein of unknown function [Cohnella sp. OV330]